VVVERSGRGTGKLGEVGVAPPGDGRRRIQPKPAAPAGDAFAVLAVHVGDEPTPRQQQPSPTARPSRPPGVSPGRGAPSIISLADGGVGFLLSMMYLNGLLTSPGSAYAVTE
jgi:hypothetical protein